ncbi:MAG: rhodanese-like domain-containing protein [Elusimicrobiales bacterium]|nr:rhodanese-like domain-containing protein [Elusimicrobiales bacterium]
MKILLTLVLVVSAAAAACAFDLGGFFGACNKAPEAPAVPAPSAEPKPGNCDFPVNIKPEEARYFIEAKHPVVIDIRRPEEYAAGHLEAVNLQLDYYAPDFKEQLGRLDRNAKYLLYCRSGHRTGITLLMMKDLGFTDIHDLEGGLNAWTAAGLPVVQ